MMCLDKAEIITVKGSKYLIIPEDEDKKPTLYSIPISYVYPEIYDEVYEKFIDKKYSK